MWRDVKMPVFQSYNSRIKSYVKWKKYKGKPVEILNVKTRDPEEPFKNVPIKKRKY